MLRLLRAGVRADRWQLSLWILGAGVFAAGSASAVLREFGTAQERAAVLVLASGNPALLAIRGLPDGSSPGSSVTFEIFVYLAVLAALMSTFLIVRHTRGDEESGRAELLGSTPIGRTAALRAALVLGLLANIAVAVLIAAGFAVCGLPLGGSLLAGLAAGSVGLAFCGLAALAAQVSRTGRSANSLAGWLVGLAFVLRAAGDALGSASDGGLRVDSSWLSWLSPLGWGQQSHPFGDDATALPLLLDLALAAVCAGGAILLARSRDLGSGLVGDRPGRATGGLGLRGPLGLAWRLQRTAVVGWGLGAALLGVFAGGLAGPAVAAVKTDSSLGAAVRGFVHGGTSSLLDTFVAAIMAFLAVLAAGAAIQAVLRTRSEEADGRAELLLSGAIGRGRPLGASVVVALLSVLVVLLAGGLAAGLTFLSTGRPDRFGSSLAAAGAQLPAALVFAAVVALVFSVLPRLAVGLGWGLLAIGFVIGQFGGLLGLPGWLRRISPFSNTPVVPAAQVDWTPLVVMTLLAVVLVAAGILLVRRRDLTS